jgi:hypothetical protein
MGGQYYIYLPFQSENLKGFAQDWEESIRWYVYQKILQRILGTRRAGFDTAEPAELIIKQVKARVPTDPDFRKVPIVCMHDEERSLNKLRQGIGMHDVLYILVYRTLVHPPVAASKEGDYLRAGELVARMVNDKVPARVLRMKLYCSHAGAGSESFAKTMRLAMNEPFPHSDLYAYNGTVTPKRNLYAHPKTHLVRRELHRASHSRIRLARPLSDDEIDQGDRALYDNLVAGIETVNRIFPRPEQMALRTTASASSTRVLADQLEDVELKNVFFQSAD